jgi:hypothetical protein
MTFSDAMGPGSAETAVRPVRWCQQSILVVSHAFHDFNHLEHHLALCLAQVIGQQGPAFLGDLAGV